MLDRDTDPEPFSHFSQFVDDEKEKHIGRDSTFENEVSYIPWAVLHEYWTSRRIHSVAQAFKQLSARIYDVQNIKEHFLRIFSTLVYCNAVQYLEEFTSRDITDQRFPMKQQPGEWPNTVFYRDLFGIIEKSQWMFFPLHFTPSQLLRRRLAGDHVLPINYLEEIRQGDAAIVRMIEIHDCCNELVPKDKDGQPSRRTFVLKTYHNKKFERLYENEVEALTMLRNSPSPNVITYYGSFRQHGTYNLILEYADGGNLADYLEKTPPPKTVADRELFWRSLFKVLRGLDRVHQLMWGGEGSARLKGIHEDIKPDNILIFKGESSSPYDFLPKVTDFGLFSHVRESSKSSSQDMGLDNHGNQLYSSPECSHNAIRNQDGPNWITQFADIFSMGAVLSDTAAWVMGGPAAQELYLERRLAQHANLSTFRESGYEGCFHDGIGPLSVINDMHADIVENCLALSDDITPCVIEMVQNHMLLQNVHLRLRARQLTEMFEQTLPRNEASQSPQSSSSSIPKAHGNPTSPLSMDNLTPTPSQIMPWSQPPASPPTPGGSCGLSPISPSSPEKETASPVDAPRRPSLRCIPAVESPIGADTTTTSMDAVPNPDSGLDSPPPPQELNVPLANHPSLIDGQRTSQGSSTMDDVGQSVTIDQIDKYRKKKNDRNAVKTGEVTNDPAVEAFIKFVKDHLAGRDQVFFIDDSSSMKAHADVIYKALENLCYVVKPLDPNRVEMCFASCPKKVRKSWRTARLVTRHLSQHEYASPSHLMERNMGTFVDEVIKRLPWRICGFNVNPLARRHVSIYVLTDGEWGSDNNAACGVEKPVQRLMDELKHRQLDRTTVSLHFLRFGDSEAGRSHLAYLDRFGRAQQMDIVDVKHISGDVKEMLIGPISQHNDSKDEDT